MLKHIPQSARIVITMIIGILVGIYTDWYPAAINDLADGFIMALQMTALPYIFLSLVAGIGTLSSTNAKAVFKISIISLIILLCVSLVYVFAAPIAFPQWQTADFYSAHTVKTVEEFRLVDLFISANPFNAMANTAIPAVVLFSVLLGIGLITARQKRRTLVILDSLQQAVANVNTLVMKFAPLGVFCIALRAVNTLNPEAIDGMAVYMLSALTVVVLLSFVVLPALIAIFTPFRYKEIIRVSREALVTAFATGSFFVVIPIIVEKSKTLVAKISPADREAQSMPGIVVPISYSLPVGGKLIAILFTLFAAWFSGAYVSFSDYVNLVTKGLPQLFGTSTIAIPHMLDIFNVSGAMFEFFIVSENLIVSRLGALLSVMFSTCLVLLIATLSAKRLTLNVRKFVVNLMVIPLISLLCLLGLRYALNNIDYNYQGYEKFIDRDFLFEPVEAKFLKAPQQNSTNQSPYSSVLDRVKQRGFLRVGYFRDDLPYSFHNKQGKLVGFDIEIFHQLASDLGVGIEFVRIFHDDAQPLLASGYLDITSGIPVIPDNLQKYTMTIEYSRQELAFIVKDERRREFTRFADVIEREDLTIGIPETFFYKEAIRKTFRKPKAWEISTPRLFFREEYQHIDAMFFGAAAASGWTLLNPEYTVVVPKPKLPAIMMAFPINKDDSAFELYMRNWITMKVRSKDIERLFMYWIEGKQPQSFRKTN
ncbi:cation:dicarboxylate symporter family transporter [Thalassotalea agarivorans]|uniref:Na+/H+-dicarboxylate symporter n=1 Tax=Thalassotalea agarivorans TaxID=349064 RepID=A0A1I0DL98_THASX|nr:cation:dicarboxylase symporter family transporter [Thalassotalea agarivorans]SET32946.1 Na+/H+-dicarboxylate symporter [Thalassotalea agarivorans]